MKCPLCQETYEQHQIRKRLCPEIECGCKNCYWCGHQIQLLDFAIDMDHGDALALDKSIEADAFPGK